MVFNAAQCTVLCLVPVHVCKSFIHPPLNGTVAELKDMVRNIADTASVVSRVGTMLPPAVSVSGFTFMPLSLSYFGI